MSEIPEPDPAQVAELDRLATAARSLQPGVLPDALWRPVLELPRWWLPAEHVDGGISPMVSEVEGVNAMFAFTTRARAEAFIREAGLQDGVADILPTAVAPAYVVDRSQIYMQVGTTILLFDCNDVGYFTPVSKLHDLWRRFFGDWVHRTEESIPEPATPAP